ncbi:MAG TPA: DUF4398 domain-containing protein [Myxococcales bacterium]|nr:DUF4398 domain-containing protein [Myxococcales bacterium]
MKRALLVGLSMLAASGCVAPVMTLMDLSDAEAEIAAAKTADAEKWAPYEYTSAELYLHEAKDRLGYSGSYYQTAYEYAQKAAEYAKMAKEKAENHPKE